MKYFVLNIVVLSFVMVTQAQTPRIKFQAPAFYPEGTVYNPQQGVFYIGSVKTGTIATVDKAGNFKEFYSEPALKSSFGMKVDSKSNSLWVCTGDPNYSDYSDSSTYKKRIHLIAIDLASAKKTKDVDLSNLFQGKHFANDLTMDAEGNIYITDSYSPVIYKVDMTGKASVFAQSEWFKSVDIGLNGIVYHPKGYLLVVNNGDGSIMKVDIKSPSTISKVRIDNFFPGADGLLLDAQGNLILVQNKSVDKAYQIVSTDNWQSAKVKASTSSEDRFQNPSTCTMADGKLYLLNAKLNELQDPTMMPSREFSLQVAVWK